MFLTIFTRERYILYYHDQSWERIREIFTLHDITDELR